MNEELKKELEREINESKNLGRSERRKKEKELQKKYNDKTIKIGTGKTFTKGPELNREKRRELVNNQNLLKEVIKIIRKYFPMLNELIDNLTDRRHKSYITYSMRTIIYTRLLALICGITTMTEISSTTLFDTENTYKNLAMICNEKLASIPNWQTIQDVIEQLNEEEIRAIRKNMVNAIIRSKMFDIYRHDGYIHVIVDATGVSSHDYNLNNNCLSRKTKKTIKYYKYVLEAKIQVGGRIVISLDTEWIENSHIENEDDKQDCETKAFKRMAPRIKKEYPRLNIVVSGDALYATDPTIKICEECKWKYIFNLKKDRLKNVYKKFEENLSYENETTHKNYFLSTNIEYKKHNVNAVRYQEIQNDKLVTFNYITNLDVNNNNIKAVVRLGRRRWKIENEGFNQQKNGEYCISHLCSRNENAIRIHYYFIQIAHTIRQLLEHGSIILRNMKLKTKKEASIILRNNLTSIHNTDLNIIETNFQLRFDDLII